MSGLSLDAKALWYLTRGSGVMALLLLTLSVALGVLTALRWRSARWPRFVTAGFHRNLTLLAVAFVGVHVLTTLADGYAPIRIVDVVVPFVSRYRPVWLGLGAVAFDLLVALVATSLLRARIGYRAWRIVHWSAYACWPLALVHALGTGSDARQGWLTDTGLAAAAVVGAAVVARALLGEGVAPRLRVVGPLVAVLGSAVGVAWYVNGPARPGWARRAGTPASLLGKTVATRTVTPVARVPQAVAGRFSSRLTGTVEQRTTPEGLTTVVIEGRLQGGPGGAIRLDLRGEPQRVGVAVTASGVSFAPARAGAVYLGSVTQLDGASVSAVVDSASGARLRLEFSLQIDAAAGRVRGVVAGTPE